MVAYCVQSFSFNESHFVEKEKCILFLIWFCWIERSETLTGSRSWATKTKVIARKAGTCERAYVLNLHTFLFGTVSTETWYDQISLKDVCAHDGLEMLNSLPKHRPAPSIPMFLFLLISQELSLTNVNKLLYHPCFKSLLLLLKKDFEKSRQKKRARAK